MNLNFAPFKSLKVRVTSLTLGIFLFGISPFAVYVGFTLRDDVQRVLVEQQFASVTLLANGIDGEVNERLGVLDDGADSGFTGPCHRRHSWFDQSGSAQLSGQDFNIPLWKDWQLFSDRTEVAADHHRLGPKQPHGYAAGAWCQPVG